MASVPIRPNDRDQRLATLDFPSGPILSRVRCIAWLDGTLMLLPGRLQGVLGELACLDYTGHPLTYIEFHPVRNGSVMLAPGMALPTRLAVSDGFVGFGDGTEPTETPSPRCRNTYAVANGKARRCHGDVVTSNAGAKRQHQSRSD